MTNRQLQELLKQYPDDARMHIHVDGKMSEVKLRAAYGGWFQKENIVLLVMSVSNIKENE